MHTAFILTDTGVWQRREHQGGRCTNVVLSNTVERKTVKVISGMVEIEISPVVATWWDSNPPTVLVDQFYFLTSFKRSPMSIVTTDLILSTNITRVSTANSQSADQARIRQSLAPRVGDFYCYIVSACVITIFTEFSNHCFCENSHYFKQNNNCQRFTTISTSSSAIAEKPRCRVDQFWPKY